MKRYKKIRYRCRGRNIPCNDPDDPMVQQWAQAAELARSPKTPLMVLEKLADSPEEIVLIALMANSQLPMSLWRKLAFHRGVDVAEAVMEAELCPMAVLIDAAKHHPSKRIRNVAGNILGWQE